jgi:hypothetical protein
MRKFPWPRGKWRFILPGFLLLGLLLLFLAPRLLVGRAISRMQTRMADDYQMKLEVGQYGISGLATLQLAHVRLYPQAGGDTLLALHSMEAGISIWGLITGNVQLSTLRLDSCVVRAWRVPGRDNLSTLMRRKPDASKPIKGFSTLANTLLRLTFNVLPDDARVRHLDVQYHSLKDTLLVFVPSLVLEDEALQGQVAINHRAYTLSGTMDLDDGQADVTVQAPDTAMVAVPVVSRKSGGRVGFHKLRFQLLEAEFSEDTVTIKGGISASHLGIYHKRLNRDTTRFENLGLLLRLNIGRHVLELDSNSTISVNSLRFHPWLRYEGGGYRAAWARLRTPRMPAQQVIDAFPQGTMETIQGMKAKGEVSLFMDFHYTTRLPDTVIFDFEVKPYDFRITSYGRTRLTMLNDTFLYRPHFGNRTIRVGFTNPNYVDLGNLSKNLINAVHYSEDGALFHHNGFSLDAFRESILENIKTKRFRRGASTITMQLVKNVFLSPEKTLERKVEEAVLVWLITQNHLVKRPRMLEVYLNIIEWGPDVYGAWEAAQFYFRKDPAWLSLEESIFLSMIIPSPRSYMYFLNDSTLQVSENHEPYFQMMARILARKKVITEEQAEQVDYRKVVFTGRAKQVAEQWRDRIRDSGTKKQVNNARSSSLVPKGSDTSQASASPPPRH